MVFADVLQSKVINYNTEDDGAPLVLPEAWRGEALVIAVLLEAFFEEGVGQGP
jgi:hypothetical protein